MTRLRHLLLITTALTAFGLAPASAGPDGPAVVGGSATVVNPGSAHVTVNQNTDKAIINWRLFDVGTNESVRFNQPNSGSVILNRVTGGLGPSQILGHIDANGRVFVINRDGILFGPNAVINTAGFLATTHDIRNNDFMAGRFNFNIPGRPDASIVNLGTITATSGGFAALVAPGVRNSGTITATLGNVALASGNGFSLDFYGDKLVTLAVGDQIASSVRDVATGLPLKALVGNDGKIKADGGRVELTAVAARQVVDAVINTSGVIEANTVGTRNGMIVLGAATRTSKPAGAPAQVVKVSGTLKAAGKQTGPAERGGKPGNAKGGTIVVSGENIQLAGAQIIATGDNGGGKVLIGGDWGGGKPDKSLVSNPSAVLESFSVPTASTVSVDAATRIDASATQNGNGGKVIVWSDQTTSFAGTILALGGREFGKGGFVETSGKTVNVSGAVNAPGGTWLLDPADVLVDAPLAASANLALNSGTNFTIATGTTPAGGNGDIFVNVPIAWNTGATLTLSAFRNIQLNDLVASPNIRNFGAAAGNLVMRADSTGIGTGTIVMNPSTFSTRVDWTNSTGKVSVYYNPAVFGTQENFTTGNGRIALASTGQITQYMLVNDKAHLQNIATNLAGTYALGRDVDASGTPISPLGNISPVQFTGILDGAKLDGTRYTISNLTVAPHTGTTNVGLFGVIGAGGVVRNLVISNASVTADPTTPPPGQFVGILAGSNAGVVSNVSVSGTVTNGTTTNGVIAGGLIGQNGLHGPGSAFGSIANSHAAVTVTVGSSTSPSSGNSAGGLVGDNPGTISNSDASGNLSGGARTSLGGLVGTNETGATIANSFATGNVSLDPATSTQSMAGGLVGFNFGTVSNSHAAGQITGGSADVSFSAILGGFVGINDGTISNSFATGKVIGDTNSQAGGFAGTNGGTITGSTAGGAVSSTDNMAGGFVAFNTGPVDNSTATGTVTGNGFLTGGFAALNQAAISNSHATGNVTGNGSLAGGFAAQNIGTITNSTATGNVTAAAADFAGGFAGDNFATITGSHATGNVTVGDNGTAGGFVGRNASSITQSDATGKVTGGINTVLGGFAAFNFGAISFSQATGAVVGGDSSFVGGFVGIAAMATTTSSSATGNVTGGLGSVVGGFAGVNFGSISRSWASGTVTGGDNSLVGGFVAFNPASDVFVSGTISQSYALGAVTGGANSAVASFVAMNTGSIDQTYGAGLVTGGPGSTLGGLVAANTLALPAGFNTTKFGGPFPVFSPTPGTVTNSYWDTTTTGQNTSAGGTPQTTAQLASGTRPTGFDPGVWTSTNGFYPCLNGACSPPPEPGPPAPVHPIPPVTPPVIPATPPAPPQIVDQHPVVISPQLVVAAQLTKDPADTKPTEPVVNTTTTTTPPTPPTPGGPKPGGPGPGGRPITPSWFGPNAILPSGMPALTETRFRDNEVMLQLGNGTAEQVADIARKLGLEILATENVGLLGRSVYRFRITGGLSVRDVIKTLEANKFAAQAQPIYVFELAQAPAAPAENQGDSAQYIVAKLRLPEVHTLATGKGVLVAVVDSTIDADHPDLSGVIAQRFDAVGAELAPHPHGTGMAGAIASHKRLLGIAPNARLLAIQAFGANTGGTQGTSLAIVKGLNWAVEQGAKVINMSFAGPADPILAQAIKALREKGIILIAAAGNAGPKSPKLFPGADANVIAVSATDADDSIYKNSNRGYITVAAPGVDILVPAPEGGYQLTTGTSVAAAHVSGVAALLLERNPNLKPDELKRILTSTATKLKGARPEDVGAGLVDPYAALVKVAPKTATIQ